MGDSLSPFNTVPDGRRTYLQLPGQRSQRDAQLLHRPKVKKTPCPYLSLLRACARPPRPETGTGSGGAMNTILSSRHGFLPRKMVTCHWWRESGLGQGRLRISFGARCPGSWCGGGHRECPGGLVLAWLPITSEPDPMSPYFFTSVPIIIEFSFSVFWNPHQMNFYVCLYMSTEFIKSHCDNIIFSSPKGEGFLPSPIEILIMNAATGKDSLIMSLEQRNL